MAYLRLAEAGAGENSLPIVIQDLENHPNLYDQLLILCTNGQQKYAFGGGGTSGSYYTTPVSFTGLSPDTQYGFRVEAIYYAGGRVVNIPASGLTYFGTKAVAITVGSIVNLTTYGITTSGFSISWNAATNASSYQVQVRESGYSSWTNYYTSLTYYSWSHFYEDTAYEYRVRGYTGDNEGPWSSIRYVTTSELSVGSVTNLNHTNVTTSGFSLSWNAASNASSYQVQYRREGLTTWFNEYTSSRSVNVSGLNSQTYYEYRVRGYSGSVEGPWTTIRTVRTQSVIPSKLSWVVRHAGNNFNLTAIEWNALHSKIIAWREYKDYPTISLPTAHTGDDVTALIFNRVMDELNDLSTPTPPPQKVAPENDVTAERINGLGYSIDSL